MGSASSEQRLPVVIGRSELGNSDVGGNRVVVIGHSEVGREGREL